MLLNLHVKNLALIEEVDVDFGPGLTVLTGETGAGKSLILGSINLALGEKANKEIIRSGCDYALIEIAFSLDEKTAKLISDMDVYMEEGNEIIVSRKITPQRSVAKINGETVNLKTLKNVMSLLIDIHGQHDNQKLLKSKAHIDFVDSFGKDSIDSIKQLVKEEYSVYTHIKEQLESMQLDDTSRVKEVEFAKFEINEIESAALLPGEDENLEAEFKRITQSKDNSEALGRIYGMLASEGEVNLSNLISSCISEASSLSEDETIEQFKSTLYDLESIVSGLTKDVYDYNESLAFDPERVMEVEERLDTINKLKIKYGNSLEAINEYLEDRKQYVERLENYEAQINQLTEQLEVSSTKLRQLCAQLTDARKQVAAVFEQKVEKTLEDLNFLSSEFKVDFSHKEPTANGADEIVFMLKANPGEPIMPLAKVASGGELSRIMLAIKSVMASKDDIDTLIFDEIDAGISGNTAALVAEKLNVISRQNQVICISHLAGIAAMADNHFLIEKSVANDHTVTTLNKLSDEEIIKELARISGGDTSDVSIEHAKHLKEQALAKKI